VKFGSEVDLPEELAANAHLAGVEPVTFTRLRLNGRGNHSQGRTVLNRPTLVKFLTSQR
jgi:hypothetical protein